MIKTDGWVSVKEMGSRVGNTTIHAIKQIICLIYIAAKLETNISNQGVYTQKEDTIKPYSSQGGSEILDMHTPAASAAIGAGEKHGEIDPFVYPQ